MNKGHLKLVVPSKNDETETSDFKTILDDTYDNIKCMITPKREKIYVLKDHLIKLYRDYEFSTGFCDIPYYLRAELKISEIIQKNKLNYYFKMFEKINKKSVLSKL